MFAAGGQGEYGRGQDVKSESGGMWHWGREGGVGAL